MPIFDQGYQHWHGPLSGHGRRWLTIARHGVRVQGKNRILRLLLLLAWIPALALVIFLALWGLLEQKSENLLAMMQSVLPFGIVQEPRTYRGIIWTLAYSYFFKTEMFFIMLLAAIAGPGLISQDLRFNALPMYFARPLNRLDYFLGKLGVIGALVASVAVGPAVFAYLVGVCFSLDLTVIKDTYHVLLASVAYGVVITFSVGTLILALSSLSRRSLYVGIAWAGLWIISSSVGGILTGIHSDSLRREIHVTALNRWLEEHPPPPGAKFRTMPNGLRYPIFDDRPGPGGPRLAGLRPEQQKEGERWVQAWAAAAGQGQAGDETIGAAMRRDWRPLCSYVANLERIADQLFDTDAAWVRMFQATGRVGYERSFADQFVMQYPWTWSAGVLAALMGIATWTLARRVKSLDRLR